MADLETLEALTLLCNVRGRAVASYRDANQRAEIVTMIGDVASDYFEKTIDESEFNRRIDSIVNDREEGQEINYNKDDLKHMKEGILDDVHALLDEPRAGADDMSDHQQVGGFNRREVGHLAAILMEECFPEERKSAALLLKQEYIKLLIEKTQHMSQQPGALEMARKGLLASYDEFGGKDYMDADVEMVEDKLRQLKVISEEVSLQPRVESEFLGK